MTARRRLICCALLLIGWWQPDALGHLDRSESGTFMVVTIYEGAVRRLASIGLVSIIAFRGSCGRRLTTTKGDCFERSLGCRLCDRGQVSTGRPEFKFAVC